MFLLSEAAFIQLKCNKNYNIVKWYYILKDCYGKAEFSAVITPVFSVT